MQKVSSISLHILYATGAPAICEVAAYLIDENLVEK
jgi:hypothetical protein